MYTYIIINDYVMSHADATITTYGYVVISMNITVAIVRIAIIITIATIRIAMFQ